MPGAIVVKRRVAADRTEVVSMLADVRGKQVVVNGDMVRSGASLLGAAGAYRETGALKISAVATHGVFPGDPLDRLRSSHLFERIIATDTHPQAPALASDFFAVTAAFLAATVA